MRMIFVNLPIKDIAASRRFFSGLGFSFNEQFSDENAVCVVVEENICVMLLAEPYFRTFINNEVADATKATEVLICLSADSRQAVDDLRARALQGGGREWKPNMDFGGMYGASFQDIDGHVWEVMYMEQAAAAEPPVNG